MYVSFEYYCQNRKIAGELYQKDAESLLELAQIKIDELTFNRIKGIGFENLTEFQQKNIKRAVCLQADYIAENGGEYTDSAGTVQSYSALDISVTVSGKPSQAELLAVDPLALALLRQTGLMRRCV